MKLIKRKRTKNTSKIVFFCYYFIYAKDIHNKYNNKFIDILKYRT